VIVADDDRPLVQPLFDVLADVGSGGYDDRRGEARGVVLIASPRAAVSSSVDRLVTAWVRDHHADSVLIVLVGGDLHWDIAANSFDAAASTALSPSVQRLFRTRPLWLDARGGVSADLVARVLTALVPEGRATRAPVPLTRPTRWRRRLVIGVVLACLAGLSLLLFALDEDEPGEGGVPAPGEPSSGDSAWWLLLIGLGVGLALGVTVSWLHRRTRREKSRREIRLATTSASAANRATVFISHNFETEHQLALRLAADLRADADVWMAPESIAPGESWLASVERGLSASRVFVALLSDASLASPWVMKEIQAAIELEVHRKLRLVPVEVQACEVPILLRTYQTLRLATGYGHLVEQTRRIVHSPV
jgi:TIR domain